MSLVDPVSLAAYHKVRLLSAFDDKFLKTICRQHKDLVRIASQNVPLLSQLSRFLPNRQVISKSWTPFGSRLQKLMLFSAGFATAIPTKSRVESDFSLLFYRRNSYCSWLIDFALERFIYPKQFFHLQQAAK
ncbi:unnamed protein product [Agarophyton chilense]